MAKGGEKQSSQSRELPAWYERVGQQAAETGSQFAKIGYMPWLGPEVAAFTPQQVASMNMADQLAQAYGYQPAGLSIPEAQDFGGGLMGYSSAPYYYDALEQFSEQHPEQFQRYTDYFGNPLPVDRRGDMGFTPTPELAVVTEPAKPIWDGITNESLKRTRMAVMDPELYLHRYGYLDGGWGW